MVDVDTLKMPLQVLLLVELQISDFTIEHFAYTKFVAISNLNNKNTIETEKFLTANEFK